MKKLSTRKIRLGLFLLVLIFGIFQYVFVLGSIYSTVGTNEISTVEQDKIFERSENLSQVLIVVTVAGCFALAIYTLNELRKYLEKRNKK